MCLLNTHASTHTQDQRWGRWEPHSSQVGFEGRPLSPHPIHTARTERENRSLFKPPSLSSSTRWHPPTLSVRSTRFPTCEAREQGKKWLREAEVRLSHPTRKEVRESQTYALPSPWRRPGSQDTPPARCAPGLGAGGAAPVPSRRRDCLPAYLPPPPPDEGGGAAQKQSGPCFAGRGCSSRECWQVEKERPF